MERVVRLMEVMKKSKTALQKNIQKVFLCMWENFLILFATSKGTTNIVAK